MTLNASASSGTEAIFRNLRQKSVKLSNYFGVYDLLFSRYIGQPITFVEIGVMNGGSLFMWREFFGPQARIIGIDLSPTALAMQQHGFEIYIGDQASPEFWREFFSKVGKIDALVDDGGHTNKHQITTVECALDNVKDGGMIVVEDVVTSYLPQFGNPSRYSFINYAKRIVDRIQERSGVLETTQRSRLRDAVYSASFFDSVVCFHIDRRLCGKSKIVSAGTEEIGALNFWNEDKRLVSFERGRSARAWLKRAPSFVERAVIFGYARSQSILTRLRFQIENRKLRRFF